MLVIKPRGAHGDGLFDVIAKVASSAAAKQVGQKVINSAVGQKIARVANSAVGKKVLNSAVAKKIAENLTEENFKKAANSAIGKQLEKVIETGVANASEKALQKLKIPTAQIFSKEIPKIGIPENFTPKIGNKRKFPKIGNKLEFLENPKIGNKQKFPETPKIGHKRKILAVVPKVGSRKKGKRRKIGRGIILE